MSEKSTSEDTPPDATAPPPLPVSFGAAQADQVNEAPTVSPAPKVEVAQPFDLVPLHSALAATRSVSLDRIRHWLEKPASERRLLFDDQREECREVAIVRDERAVPAPLWIIGDLHADLLTLANLLAHAERTAPAGVRPSFIFLGDFVDRGRHDHETLLLLLQLTMDHPQRVCIIPGNHDIDLRWDETGGRFRVTIEPAEYCERLNGILASDRPADREQIELARLLIPFWKERPKAAFLPDGTFFAHGGFPHTDLHDSLRAPADLGAKRCLDDFLWARLADAPKKRPNRGNRGHEFGSRDFEQFCRVLSETVGVPVQRFVRGHDHVANRWQVAYDGTVLTVNAMGRRMEGEIGPDDPPHPFPVMARHVPNRLPDVVRLPLPVHAVDAAFQIDRPLTSPALDDFTVGGPPIGGDDSRPPDELRREPPG
jgi:hypothetical protein